MSKRFSLAMWLCAIFGGPRLGLAQEPSTSPAATSTAPTQSADAPLDITSSAARATRGTAHTLNPRTFALNTGVFGLSPDEIFGALGVDYGVGHGVQLGLNVLHASAGVINLRAKWTFFESSSWAVSAEFNPFWVHGNWVWLGGNREAVGNIDLLGFPLGVAASFHPTPWLQFDLGANYMDVEIFGKMDGDSLAFDAGLALRGFNTQPSVRLHIKKRLSVYASARLPLWMRAPGTVEATVELEPGVEAGVRSAGARSVQFQEHFVVTTGARAMASKKVFLDFALNYGPATERLYGFPLYPKLGVEVRF